MHVFIIAGEPSGDILGARLMAALKRKQPDVRFSGIGGNLMTAQGLQSLFSIEELSVMGLFEVLPGLPKILKRIHQTAAAAITQNPDVVVTIDSPDFCFRVGKRIKKEKPETRLVHYVAPTVWAWRPGRAKKVARFLDHLLALFPFEPPYFEKEGLSCDFVGHPVVEASPLQPVVSTPDTRQICLLPGSRMGEIKRHVPVFSEAMKKLEEHIGAFDLVIPTLPHLETHMRTFFPKARIVTTESEKKAAFQTCDAALAASGTVTLELAAAGTPAIISYKLNWFSGWMARRLIRVKYVGLINLLLNRLAVPEFLLEDCRADKLSDALANLLQNETLRAQQKRDYLEALAMLSPPDQTPSDAAATAVLKVLKDG